MSPSPPTPPHRASAHQLSSAASIPEWVGQQYYRHGLFCASHPRVVLLFTALGIVWTCFPLLTLQGITSGDVEFHTASSKVDTETPVWMSSPPVAYLQQIQMRAMIYPYRTEDLIRTDAFRGPIASAFKLHLEDVVSFVAKDTGNSNSSDQLQMDKQCLRTDGLSSRYKSTSAVDVLPEYGCLILSPANLWQRDPATFQMDANVISTVFNYQRSREGHSSLTDLTFGMRLRDAGLTKYPVRNRQRVISYAVTVVLKKHDPEFIEALRSHLKDVYPLHADNNTRSDQSVVHMFFPSRSYYSELLPFFFTLVLLFIYVYFSCIKMELVRSKFGIALSAVFSVVVAILMSLGLSGLSLNMSSVTCIVPYLVAFISLENLLVLTRSVHSTPAHLDVKIRVAQGLSREGWNITKNLFTEMTILTMGFFIGILDSSIQEFCLLAVMGLLSDFFLQTFFFTTILSMDMSQMELRDTVKRPAYRRREMFQHPISGPGLIQTSSEHETNVMAPQCSTLVQEKEAKRVRFINFWAKRRLIQRLFVLGMIVWISIFVYQTRVLETVFQSSHSQASFDVMVPKVKTAASAQNGANDEAEENKSAVNISAIISDMDATTSVIVDQNEVGKGGGAHHQPSILKKLQYGVQETWKRLPQTHWPMLFGLYNVSLQGRHLAILPTIRLSMVISPESAAQLRHPLEILKIQEEMSINSVESLKQALELSDDDEDEQDLDDHSSAGEAGFSELSPFVPSTPAEVFLAIVFACPSILFLLYLMIVFYRCICSRNYAEWRTSWQGQQSKQSPDIYTQVS